jgi:hypothetical protein
MARTPVHDPGAENLPPQSQVRTPPGSATRRVLAQKAIDLAAKTPLPGQFAVMAVRFHFTLSDCSSSDLVTASETVCYHENSHASWQLKC